MIKKLFFSLFLFFLLSCSSFEFVLNDGSERNSLKNKTSIVINGTKSENFYRELSSFFGNNKDGEFILIAGFSEKKENRVVKKNQVAEKIDYEIKIDYEVYYKNKKCKIYNKEIVSKFSFVPKSFGYNFGTDRSLEKLYKNSIRKNIKNFIDVFPKNTSCI